MSRKVLWAGTGLVAILILLLTGVVVSIRFGLQHYSDRAVAFFPGDRVEALIKLVDCESCTIEDRNHAVWALGQIAEQRAVHVLRKHHDGEPCSHATRLCQYELGKAIRMIDTRGNRWGPVWQLAGQLH